MLSVRPLMVYGEVTVPSETQMVSVVYSNSQEVSVPPGTQATVMLLSVVSVTYGLGATQVAKLSQGTPKITLLREVVVEPEPLPEGIELMLYGLLSWYS